jgi:glycosyltransferase involved in cell wall biosynthesis
LNCSYAEGQPQGALEAMGLGKPCILTAVPGNLNIIRNGVQGFYIENKAEFIEAGDLLISDRPLRIKMGQFARELVEKHYTLQSELDAYSKLYKGFNSL